jgi:alpha-tubulin suppressor-like RCC1 family protein
MEFTMFPRTTQTLLAATLALVFSTNASAAFLYRVAAKGVRAGATGPAPAPALSVEPSSWDFGTVNLGSAPVKSFTVTNQGTAAATDLTVDAPNAPFALQSSDCGPTLEPKASCTVEVKFSPTDVTETNGTYSIQGGGSVLPVTLTGKGNEPTWGIASLITGSISAGLSGFIKNDGSAWVTGSAALYQAGAAIPSYVTTHTKVAEGVKTVAFGRGHGVLLKTDGTLWTAGRNQYGQLGRGDTVNTTDFAQVLTNVKSASIGTYNTFVIRNDDSVWATGFNWDGTLGTGSSGQHQSSFVRLTSLDVGSKVTTIAAGQDHVLALRADGTVWGTGGDAYKRLGGGGDRATFQRILNDPLGYKAIAVGIYHSMALRNDGTLWVAGFNGDGRLGDGTTPHYNGSGFHQVLTNVAQITTGGSFSVAVKTDGTLWVTGGNSEGQLGDGSTTSALTFKQASISDVKSVAVTYANIKVLKNDGTLWGSGFNAQGQLGDGTTTGSLIFKKLSPSP